MKRTRIIITGDRGWYCLELARTIIAKLEAKHGEITIIHGGARGVDAAFDKAAGEAGCQIDWYPANWEEQGNAAGPIRNAKMIAAGADFVLAFHRYIKASKGTKNCCRQALDAGIPVWLIDGEDAEPERLSLEMLEG